MSNQEIKFVVGRTYRLAYKPNHAFKTDPHRTSDFEYIRQAGAKKHFYSSDIGHDLFLTKQQSIEAYNQANPKT